jgi:hypothetical protein
MRGLFATLGVLVLAGCGGSEPSNTVAANEASNAGSALNETVDAPIAEGPKGTAATQGLDCAQSKPPASGKNDILGVSFGMPAEQAFGIIACSNPAFTVEYNSDGGLDLPALSDGTKPRTQIAAQIDGESIFALLVGLPGQEKVVGINRSVEFAEGKEPAADAILKSLTDKYGQPTYRNTSSGSWAFEVPYTPQGQVIAEGSSLFSTCTADRTNGEMQISDECGLSVNFVIALKDGNPGLAKSFKVSIVEQAKTMTAVDQYEAAARSAKGVAQKDQVDKAGQDKSRMPTL